MAQNCVKFKAGDRVRLINDPGREGVITGKTQNRAGTCIYQVSFHDGKSYQPEYQIKLIEDDTTDIYDLLEAREFGRASDLRRNLTFRLLSGHLANLFYSMDTTNTEFFAYQYKPVFSFLESPANGILVADEVGLGKTIEAGLIWTELRYREDARRMLILCPAMLREKWQLELQNRFGVDATIVNAKDLLNELKKNKNELFEGKALVASIQGIRPSKGWRLNEKRDVSPSIELTRYLETQMEDEPIIDFLVIDEAHYLRNPESQNNEIGHLLRANSMHIALLSATPINLHSEDLFHLLNLVDSDFFNRKDVFSEILQANEPIIKAQQMALNKGKYSNDILAELQKAQEHMLLSGSQQLAFLLNMGISDSKLLDKSYRIILANRIERVNLLRNALTRTRKSEVNEWKVVRRAYHEFIAMSDEEERFYNLVTESVRKYAQETSAPEGFLLATPQRQVSSSMYAAAGAWKKRYKEQSDLIYENFGADISSADDIGPLVKYLIGEIVPKIDIEKLWSEDSKYLRLKDVLINYFKEHKNEKVIVFSYFRPTLAYLSSRLSEDGMSNITLVGGMSIPKQNIIDDFSRNKDVKILLSSEVASEGVDLQFCRTLINYDLPWNPMRVEQRIGRIDRLGQESPNISIWNLCYADTIDHKVLDRLFKRLKIFEQALGGMEIILGEEIKKLTIDLLSKKLTPDEEDKRIEQTALAIEMNKQEQDELESKASHLIAHGGYILEKVKAAHDFKNHVTERDLEVYVKDYLKEYCQGHVFQKVESEHLEYDIQLPFEVASKLNEFMRQKKLSGHTRLDSGSKTRCRFVNKVWTGQHKYDQISQFHPFIRFISDDLRRREKSFYSLVAVRLKKGNAQGNSPGIYTFSTSLWKFEGLRNEEELRVRVMKCDESKPLSPEDSYLLINSARSHGIDWLSAKTDLHDFELRKNIDNCLDLIMKDYEESVEEKKNENYDRISLQKQSAEQHKSSRMAVLKRVLEDYKRKGNTRMIPATEGRIRKLNERFEMQIQHLNNKNELRTSLSDVCSGVILVD